MSTRKKCILYVMISVVVYFAWGLYVLLGYCYGQTLHNLANSLCHYIEQNDGKFPENEKQLVDKGFIVKGNGEVQCRYFFSPVDNVETERDRLENCYRYHLFKIRYGTKLEDIKTKKGRLYDKKSGKEIFLIGGPFQFLLKYKRHNFRMYQEMRKGKLAE